MILYYYLIYNIILLTELLIQMIRTLRWDSLMGFLPFLVTFCKIFILFNNYLFVNFLKLIFECISVKVITIVLFHFMLAFIPYPLIFGAVVDSTCLVWEEKCGKTGNCWIYDQDKFKYYLHGTALAFICVGSLMDLGIIYNAKHIKNFYDDSYDTKEEKETTNGDNNNVIAMTGVTLKANDIETDGVI